MPVDTAVPVLAGSGLLPDWVFTLDAQVYTLQDFLPCREPGITLLCDLTANPQTLRLFSSVYFYSTRFHPLSLFDRLDSAGLLPTGLPPRGSVGVSAVEAALAITQGPVLFTGLDFSYTKNQTHARGAPFHLTLLHRCTRVNPCGMDAFRSLMERPLLRLAGKDGQPVLTDLVLRSYASQLQTVNAANLRSHDLSRQGLPVGADRVDTLKQLAEFCDHATDHHGMQVAPVEVNGLRSRPDVSSLQGFCNRELSLLAEVSRSIGATGRGLEKVLDPVEYLHLSLPEVNPDRRLSSSNRSRIDAKARMLSVYLQRTLAALTSST
jgi:hypothetical protein